MRLILLLLLLFCFSLHNSFAAGKDSLKTKNPSAASYSKAPSIGYNLGYLSFFGDVKLNGYKPSFASRLGHQFYIALPLSNSFALSYNFTAGKIFGEETRGTDNLNFRTSLVGQSLRLEYNFHNIIKPAEDSKFTVLPLLGFGVEALIFRAKADMQDANDANYYYWNDGTIKNLPQTPENEDLAVPLERDYTYETELRDANLDGFGKYSQITFAMPFTLGADFRAGRNFSFRLGATYHLTFSDMLDNLSSVGSGNRKGEEGKDNFLFSSFGISYKFSQPRGKKQKGPDTDEDGIADAADKCANTPKGAKVDKNGCPQVNEKDRDADGVLDVVDRCRDTKAGAAVDKEGCSEEQKLQASKQAAQKDSLEKLANEKARALKDSVAKAATAQSKLDTEIKPATGDFYFADLNKNGKVEVAEVNEFIDRLFDGDKNVTVQTMDQIIEYFFDQEPAAEAKPAEVIPEQKKADAANNKVVQGKEAAETKPVEAKGEVVVEKKPLETKNLDSKYHFADLNKNGKIEKAEIDVFIARMEKGDKDVPIQLIDEILRYYFNQE